jgi:hypothetical protein
MADTLEALDSIEAERLVLFSLHDERVRELEKQHVASWSEMAEICLLIDGNSEWRIGGYRSFGAWLESAAPQSKAAMYAAMGLVKELRQDVSEGELRQIPLGSAKVLAKMPRRLRKRNIENAKKRPREFVKDVQAAHPELHIETEVPRQYAFTASQADKIDGAVELAKMLFDLTSDEQAWESIAVEFMQSHQETWEKIKAGEII